MNGALSQPGSTRYVLLIAVNGSKFRTDIGLSYYSLPFWFFASHHPMVERFGRKRSGLYQTANILGGGQGHGSSVNRTRNVIGRTQSGSLVVQSTSLMRPGGTVNSPDSHDSGNVP